jgi:hypothetical protein
MGEWKVPLSLRIPRPSRDELHLLSVFEGRFSKTLSRGM